MPMRLGVMLHMRRSARAGALQPAEGKATVRSAGAARRRRPARGEGAVIGVGPDKSRPLFGLAHRHGRGQPVRSRRRREADRRLPLARMAVLTYLRAILAVPATGRTALMARRRPDERYRPENPDRTGSGGSAPPDGAPARPNRRAEHRPDESRRLLPQLPLELAQGGGGRARLAPHQGGEPDARLWDALRRVEGSLSDRGDRRAERRLRGRQASPLRFIRSLAPAQARGV